MTKKGEHTMKKTKLTAILSNLPNIEFPVYRDMENDRLYVKVNREYISTFHPDMLKNNIRILQPLK